MKNSEIYQTIYNFLIGVAKGGGRTTYTEVAKKAGVNVRSPLLYRTFQQICTNEATAGRGMLCSVVGRKDSRLPGDGFFAVAKNLKLLKPGTSKPDFHARELGKVYAAWKVAAA